MDKIKINNQVVIMRKFVKQAKVHSINRLVKQMKLLQNRKGDEAKVEKCKRKAERFREEIVLLKSIKPDDVSKSALSKARDWKEILQQKTSTLGERCLAMLASYEAVQKEVESFHSSNPNLVTRIPSLVKEWEEKSKLHKGSPFDKQKNKLERNNSWTENNILSNALDKEVSLSSVKKFKMGVHDDLNELEVNNDVIQHDISIEDKEHESESLKGSKNQPKFNSSKLLKKISPLKYEQKIKICPVNVSENVESDKSSDEDLSNDKDVTHEDSELQSKNYHVNKISDSAKSSDEELCNDGEDSSNTDLEEADSDRKISETDSSESIDQNNTVEIGDKFNENKLEQLKSDDDEGSDFFQGISRKRKLSENKNFSAEKMTGKTKNEKILLDKPIAPKQIQSNMCVYSNRNTTENNLKTITMLNLDDLQGLNEIPVEEITEHEENSDKDEEKFPTQKRQDPFFLGRDELNPTTEDRLNVYSRNEKRQKFLRNEESNVEKRSFQKSLNTSEFFRREPYKFNNERNFKRGGFQPKNSTGRFQHKERNEFQNKDKIGLNRKERRAILSKNRGEFYTKGENDFQALRSKICDEQSRKSNFQNEGNSLFRKDRMTNVKGGVISEKPLHPSWEAKRKQKEFTQTRFQGKKMIFDD